jgi:hypothetical protein
LLHEYWEFLNEKKKKKKKQWQNKHKEKTEKKLDGDIKQQQQKVTQKTPHPF